MSVDSGDYGMTRERESCRGEKKEEERQVAWQIVLEIEVNSGGIERNGTTTTTKQPAYCIPTHSLTHYYGDLVLTSSVLPTYLHTTPTRAGPQEFGNQAPTQKLSSVFNERVRQRLGKLAVYEPSSSSSSS